MSCPSGFYDSLTPQQTQQLQEFKQIVQKEREWHLSVIKQEEEYWRSQSLDQIYPEYKQILESFKALTDDQIASERELDWDYECLRFLRANKWDISKASENYIEFIQWRRDKNIDQILHSYPPKMELIHKIVPSNVHGFDRFGNPLYIERSGAINPAALLSLVSVDEVVWAHVWVQEMQVQRCKLNYRKTGKYADQFANILDLAGLHLEQRKGLKFTQAITKLDARMYPERMASVFIVNAPSIFPIIWKIVKPMLDPVTQEKIHVLSGNLKEVLSKHFDPSELPGSYGGTCNKCLTAPDCIPLSNNEEILASLPQSKALEKAELLKFNVARGDKYSKKIQGKEGETFCWSISSGGYEIGLGAAFVPASGGETLQALDLERMKPNTSMPSQGCYTTEADGELTLLIDNSFAWVSKDIQLKLCVAKL